MLEAARAPAGRVGLRGLRWRKEAAGRSECGAGSIAMHAHMRVCVCMSMWVCVRAVADVCASSWLCVGCVWQPCAASRVQSGCLFRLFVRMCCHACQRMFDMLH